MTSYVSASYPIKLDKELGLEPPAGVVLALPSLTQHRVNLVWYNTLYP